MIKNRIDVIAIDGPAGSGKSTTARLVAQKLGFTYLDTGAMYRALTLKALRYKLNFEHESAILSLIDDSDIELEEKNGRLKIFLDDEEVTRKIRSQNVSTHVAKLAAYPGVRKWMVRLQRKFGEQGRVVAEGRDIGTVVFPNARLKIFLVASLNARAKRRLSDYKNEKQVALNKITKQILDRDLADRSRTASPLKKAADAIELDTTELTIDQQVDFVIEQWNKKILNTISNKCCFSLSGHCSKISRITF